MRRTALATWLSSCLVVASLAVTHGVLGMRTAQAQPADEFYKGKSIDLYIGFTPGGGYDAYARLLARHMGDHIPGKPTIIPRQKPGAASLAAAEFMFTIAPKDGTALATIDQAISVQQALGDPTIKFDSGKFIYIGNPSAENNTVVTWHISGVRTIEDARTQDVPMGSTGLYTSAHYILALNALAGTRFKVIAGYPGGNEINLAMEKGEVAGRGSNSWASWKATKPDWLREKKINILVQIGLKKSSDLPDVPLLMDVANNPEDKAALKLLSAPTMIGRPIITTPDVPADRVGVLRRAFEAGMQDPALVEEASKSKLDLNPVSGAELQQIVAEILATPKSVAARLTAAIGDGK